MIINRALELNFGVWQMPKHPSIIAESRLSVKCDGYIGDGFDVKKRINRA